MQRKFAGYTPLIEQVMVFALGFLVAGLLTLLFLPAFWKRAVRLSTRRLEAQMPLSMEEIVAERDQLRAVFATELRQLEQNAEALQEAHARDLSELGRRATEIARLERDLNKLKGDLAHAQAESEGRALPLLAAQTEIGALHQAHWGIAGEAERNAKALAALEEKHFALTGLADERRVLIASLEMRVTGLELSFDDMLQRYETAKQELVEKTQELDKVIKERDALRDETSGAVARRDALLVGADELNMRIGELERAHRAERRERVRLESETANALRSAADAAERENGLRAGMARQLEELNAREHALQQEIESLRVARADAAAEPSTSGVSADDAAQLRKSISEIGAEVVRLVSSLEDEAAEKARAGAPLQPVGDRVHDLQARAKRAAPTH